MEKALDGLSPRSLQLVRKHILWFALCVQAVLLGWRLDLLPRWDDELFTLRAAVQTPSQIIHATQAGVHPPLYFLLVHHWLDLPFPGSVLVRARALSAALALVATLLFYLFWLRPLPFEQRVLFLSLWVFSPFLVLYARMARGHVRRRVDL